MGLSFIFTAIGVLMLLALTVERFISVCYPAQARNLCDTNRAYIAVGIIPITTLVIYAPYAFISQINSCLDIRGKSKFETKKTVFHLEILHIPEHLIYLKGQNINVIKAFWFMPYKYCLEVLFKLVPAVILVYLNIRIIHSYRAVCQRRRRMTSYVSWTQNFLSLVENIFDPKI